MLRGREHRRNSSDARAAFRDGLAVIAPITPSVVPFGLMVGVAAREAGLDVWASFGMSVLIAAGAAQLAAAQLMDSGALPAVVVFTALVINLRLAIYSASLSPYLGDLPAYRKWPLAYLLTDQAYAVTISRFLRRPDQPCKPLFYLGAALPVWVLWIVTTGIGIELGSTVPESWQLGFAVPLIFLALLVPAVHDRPTLIAALIGGAVACLGQGLPFHLGLVTGAVSGIVAGCLADRVSPDE